MDSQPWLHRWGLALLDGAKSLSMPVWVAIITASLLVFAVAFYIGVYIAAPVPRLPRKSEKEFVVRLPDGSLSKPRPLPCWYDDFLARKEAASNSEKRFADSYTIEPPELFMSVVVPAYNEEKRMEIMLEEAIEFLDKEYPGKSRKPSPGQAAGTNDTTGYEILIVSDGSKDDTTGVALRFAQKHGLFEPSSGGANRSIRVIELDQNRGKGGAVVHGMRHVRGAYAVFADADGASRFHDLGKLVDACARVQDADGRAVGIGSRAHLVGSEEVVKRSFLRNALMHAFHVILRLMTPPKTAAIGDTQCGFKLFTRPALPFIIPYMHSEGWIFDVEMLMLAESANIPMVEVSIGWKEVLGSKLNVIWDSLGMAWGLAILRVAWMIGVYKSDL